MMNKKSEDKVELHGLILIAGREQKWKTSTIVYSAQSHLYHINQQVLLSNSAQPICTTFRGMDLLMVELWRQVLSDTASM